MLYVCVTLIKRLEAMKTEFTNKLEAAILKAFPQSGVDVSVKRIIGVSCYVRFTIGKDSSEYPNGILQNDDFETTIIIYGFDVETGEPKEKLQVESNCNRFSIQPEPGSYLAFGNVKTGWRNFTATPEKTIEKIGAHFAKMRGLVVENYERLTPHTKALVDKKGYNTSI